MNKTLIICSSVVAVIVVLFITYSECAEMDIEKEFAKAGLEQCQSNIFDTTIWVKNCQEYIKARNGEK